MSSSSSSSYSSSNHSSPQPSINSVDEQLIATQNAADEGFMEPAIMQQALVSIRESGDAPSIEKVARECAAKGMGGYAQTTLENVKGFALKVATSYQSAAAQRVQTRREAHNANIPKFPRMQRNEVIPDDVLILDESSIVQDASAAQYISGADFEPDLQIALKNSVEDVQEFQGLADNQTVPVPEQTQTERTVYEDNEESKEVVDHSETPSEKKVLSQVRKAKLIRKGTGHSFDEPALAGVKMTGGQRSKVMKQEGMMSAPTKKAQASLLRQQELEDMQDKRAKKIEYLMAGGYSLQEALKMSQVVNKRSRTSKVEKPPQTTDLNPMSQEESGLLE